MGSTVKIILLFSGLWAPTLCASRQFYVVEDKNKWHESQTYCRANYTDLATIENDEEMNTVKELLKTKTNNYWIGLEQNHTSSSWSWSDGTPYNTSNNTYWWPDEPNYGSQNNFCVELRHEYNYRWNDAGCTHQNSFICYKKRTPLTVITEKKTWREALRFCRQHHVDLVSVYSPKMQEWVKTVSKNVSTDIWIGLRHTCALGFWFWVKGDTICYQNWAPGNGTGVEDCNSGERTGALLSESKQWVSLPETRKLYFICITFK